MNLRLITERINQIRQERGISGEELARYAGVSAATVWTHFRKGCTNLVTITKYCEALGCTIADVTDNVVDLSKFTLERNITSFYPYNLALKVLEGYNPSKEDVARAKEEVYKVFVPGFLRAIETLNDREQKVLEYRYKNGLTYEDTGKQFNVTRERVRQIELRAVRKLRNPVLMKTYIMDALDKASQIEARCIALESENKKLKEQLRALGATTTDDGEHIPVDIEYMDLSVRSFNCLRRHGIRTVDDLKGMTMYELMMIRNLGKKSRDEVIEKAKKYGIFIDREEGKNEV